MATLPELLKTTVELDGSDLHLTTSAPPTVRVHGKLVPLKLPALTAPSKRPNFLIRVVYVTSGTFHAS